ncbi:MAG: phosphatidylserine decarboxylase family protein [Calditrichaeota bacterium]|nr:phosphatidylserine decarboxylase family protein [Calditrichota bacterium]
MIARDGIPIIIGTGIIFIVLLAITLIVKHVALWIITIPVGVFFVFNFFFFRDPERSFKGPDNVIVAPADGKVILITEEEEPYFFKGRAKKISIFMSVFNCHVNRIPADGTVDFLKYKPGQFLAAFNHRSGEENEQQIIGITTPYGKILFKQIAGLIARRIVCKLQEGQKVRRTQRFGMIRYGSRLDVFLPLSAEIKVKLNQTTRAGETVIGEFKR